MKRRKTDNVLRWLTAPYIATIMLVVLVATVVFGFVLVLNSQTKETLENRRIAKCILQELENHRDRAEDVYNGFASRDEDALRKVLQHPPDTAPCLERVE